ncbi:DUF1707 SHOCT-like domain-containing protein [Actinoplanes sp. NPDC004185]
MPSSGDGYRVSGADRERAVAALGKAFLAGRLDTDEYTRRVGSAVAAVHYHDLQPLTADLPGRAARLPAPRRPLPPVLVLLWRWWIAVVAAAVLTYGAVSLAQGGPAYPWPLWIAGPSGLALTVLTVTVRRRRTTARPYPRSRPRRYPRRRPVRRSVRLPR